ncbi:transporter substrate-binding domain-containing protein [Pseudomonas sp. NPDC087612]|uniref:transporter substrate-binding domain-containing protein n=1 Tax=Pseudomonas sp. NPDC087612 TaxID=3364441 RepID=UPI0037F71A65
MKKISANRWITSICLLWLSSVSQITFGETGVKLLVHTPLTAPDVVFDSKTQAWLDRRSTIRVAFWGGARPPMHIGFDPNSFEGVTADVLGLLQNTLGVRMQMLRFEDRPQALQAMARGEVDMLALNDVTDGDNAVFKTSKPYLLNHKVIIRRINDPITTSADNAVERMAYIGATDSHIKRIQEQHPRSKLVPYVNHLNALAALAYDQVDVVRTNAVTAEFLLSSYYRNSLYITADANAGGVADINFAVSVRYPYLLEAVNKSLAAIPVADMLRITSNWALSNNFVIAPKSLDLTPEQVAWIAQHPKLKVVVADAYAPLTFFDDKNRLKGLSADMLKLVERLTGLEFEVVRSDSVSDMVKSLQEGKVDLIAALSIGDFRLEPHQYTRPYMISPFVVVTRRNEAGIKSLEELNGLRLALPWGSPVSFTVHNQFPNITQVTAQNATKGLEMLAAGEVEGSVHTQFGADYFINHHFQADLHIASAIGTHPARVAMAVGPGHQVLKDIINSALLKVRPDEFKAMTDRWRVHEPPAVASSWSTYKDLVFTVIVAATLFGLVFLVWNYYLRVQINKRQKAEQALEDQLQFTRTLIDGAPLALYVRDGEGRLVDCNRAYLDFFNITREAVIGRTLMESDVAGVEISARYHQIYMDALKNGQTTFDDMDFELRGQQYRVYHWILPYLNSTGQYIGVIGGWLDVTERSQLIEQLRQAKEVANNANRSKSVFLASMSHEIRTPISALIGLIELLRVRGGTAAEIEESLEVAHQSAQSLLSLIGDILDLSKIEAGAMTPSPRPTQLIELTQSIYRLFATNARKKNIEFRLVTEVQNNGVMIDALMLNQVISNLISNAIKFTEQGSVQLLLRELPGTQIEGYARFAIQVTDTGKGLNEAQRKEVFEPFVQADPQAHRAAGTGLGLSICASLAALLGAKLSVDSQPGLGSCFTLLFEAELVEIIQDKDAPDANLQSGQKLRILVVEDHAPNRTLLCRQLEFLGHEAVPCDDGEAAFELWMNAESEFDLTITDCNMPRMNGFELTRRMREIEQQKAVRLHPIFGLTANAQSEASEMCLAAGMNRCLFKPVSIETLASAIAEVAQSHARRAQAAAVKKGGELEKIRLLSPESYAPLVEQILISLREDSINLEVLARECDRPGLARIAHKIRGGATLTGNSELVEACSELERFVLEDIEMPYEVQVERIKACLRELESELQEVTHQ